MAFPLILLPILLSLVILTQLDTSDAQGHVYEPQGLCHQFTDTGNATGSDPTAGNDFGVWRVAVHTIYSRDEIDYVGITPNGDPPTVFARLWLDLYEDLDLNDGNNPFSACAYVFKGLPSNTERRGQDDDGYCQQTLSNKCVTALAIRAGTSAQYLVGNPTLGPFNNLTPPILDPICTQIANDIGFSGSADAPTLPKECIPYMVTKEPGNDLFPVLTTYTLTDNVTKPINCSFQNGYYGNPRVLGATYNTPPGLSFYENGLFPADVYDEMVRTVWPIMTVRMPPANNSRIGAWMEASASMTCLRASNIKADSRKPAFEPGPTPVHFPVKFTKGEIAGIVVASVAGVLIIGPGAWYYWRVRKRRTDPDFSKIGHGIGTNVAKLAQKDGAEVYQLGDTLEPLQLDGKPRTEIGEDPRPELHGRPLLPQEPPGSSPTPSQK